MKRYCLTLDLQDDAEKIKQYEEHHKKLWPEITGSIRESGVLNMEIYRWKTRLFMVMDVDDSFSFEKKKLADEHNPAVQKWEQLMWNYQQGLPGAGAGEKWVLMNKIFELE